MERRLFASMEVFGHCITMDSNRNKFVYLSIKENEERSEEERNPLTITQVS